MSNVLVVDDDPRAAPGAGHQPRGRGYTVAPRPPAPAALRLAAARPPDVVVLDLGLPDLDGAEVIAGLRGWTDVPIIVLSAREQPAATRSPRSTRAPTTTSTKPFGMDELLARLRAALRRGQRRRRREPTVVTDAFTVDLARRPGHRAGGADVRLTPTEWRLLEVLARNPGRLVTTASSSRRSGARPTSDPDQLPARLHGPAAPQARARPVAPRHLLTEPGLGYRFEI